MRLMRSENLAIIKNVFTRLGATTTALRGRAVSSRNTATNYVAVAPCNMRRRGTAEIELLLSISVLIVLLNGTIFFRKLGHARLGGLQTTGFEAFQDATQANPPQYATNPVDSPVDGFTSVRPGLPNRLHEPKISTPVSVVFIDQSNPQNSSTTNATMVASSALPSPSWTFPAYPDSADETATSQWFQNYVQESHQELIDPLGLAPAWTP